MFRVFEEHKNMINISPIHHWLRELGIGNFPAHFIHNKVKTALLSIKPR